MADTALTSRAPHGPPGGPWAEFASLSMIGALLAAMLLYKTGGRGWEVLTVGTLSVPAYLVAVRRRDWLVLGTVIGVGTGAAVGWILHLPGETAWTMSWLSLATVAVVWAPWPTLERTAAVAMLWTLTAAPLLVLVAANLELDVSWVADLSPTTRLGFEVGTNELGIVTAIAVLAALMLRSMHDSHPRYLAQAAVLVIAGNTGTRTIVPLVGVAALLWWWGRRHRAAWRGWLTEAVPWALYLVFALVPMVVRTVSRLGTGPDRLTSGRWEIWQEYGAMAATAPWSGHGVGYTRTLSEGILQTDQLPHNLPLELVVEIGIPGAVIALVGLGVVVVARARRIGGPDRWLWRTPLVVLLPTLALLEIPLRKPELTLPLLGFSAAAARLADPESGWLLATSRAATQVRQPTWRPTA